MHHCTGENCARCQRAIDAREFPESPDPGWEERAIRRAEAREEARIYGEDRWY